MEKILIIGGVAAGATAAAKARRMSSEAQITILEAGPDISFANCGLPYYIGGDITSRSKLILQSPESFNEAYQVDVHINTKATSIDRLNKVVHATDTQSGQEKSFEYTKLILAQGGKPIAPPITGAKQDHVFTLWTLSDMDNIDDYIKNQKPKTAVVVGGGFIGLEMTEALVKRGLDVSVIEASQHVMTLMEPEMAGVIQEELQAYGVHVHTGKSVTEIAKQHVVLNDGTQVAADMVLLSIGVRPTLVLASEAGLEIGTAGGLLVDQYLKTSDEAIYAAGDMVEIEHRVLGKKVRIPLAGPANRQGRIAAENALGKHHAYPGAIGTSIVKVFEAVAGITGLSLKAARAEGLDADAIVIHKENHTTYYPGAEMVSVLLVYDRATGTVLGGQTAGYNGADRRLDVLATAVSSKLTLSDLADMDFAYSPPLGNANDAINMAAFVAQNRQSGYSPSLTVNELDSALSNRQALWVDLRDVFAFQKAHVEGAVNIPFEVLRPSIHDLPKDKQILVYDATGKKGHQALRMLVGEGFENILNVSGGFLSLSHHVRAVSPVSFDLALTAPDLKTLGEAQESASKAIEVTEDQTQAAGEGQAAGEEQAHEALLGPMIVDVRGRDEYAYGAFPGALNIPLDEVELSLEAFGAKDREIIVYCASGARSAYAQRILQHHGFTNVQNGGGIARMMSTL